MITRLIDKKTSRSSYHSRPPYLNFSYSEIPRLEIHSITLDKSSKKTSKVNNNYNKISTTAAISNYAP